MGDRTISHDYFILEIEPSFDIWPSGFLLLGLLIVLCLTGETLFRKGEKGLDCFLSIYYIDALESSQQPFRVGTVYPILQTRRWGLREDLPEVIKYLTAESYLPLCLLSDSCSCDRLWATHAEGMILTNPCNSPVWQLYRHPILQMRIVRLKKVWVNFAQLLQWWSRFEPRSAWLQSWDREFDRMFCEDGYVHCLSDNMVATSHMQLFSTWDVASATEELKF